MFQATDLHGFNAFTTVAASTIVWQTPHSVDGGGVTPITFTAHGLGSLGNGRMIIVGVGIAGTGTPTTTAVAITGGSPSSAMTQRVSQQQGVFNVSLWTLMENTLTSADIVVTLSANVSRLGIGVWAAYEIGSAVPHDTAVSTADPSDLTIDVPTEGVVVAFSSGGGGGSVTSAWTNATERFDGPTEGTGNNHTISGADYTSTTAETNRAVSVDRTSATNPAAVAASWT